MMQDTIYETATACLGTGETLDSTIPVEVRCAEAVSAVLKKAGVQGIPQRGFAGTDDLYQWLCTNRQFQEVANPQYGGVIIAPTQGSNEGHCGITLKKGIASNNSFGGVAGIFSENYSYEGWLNYFNAKGLTTYYFIPV